MERGDTIQAAEKAWSVVSAFANIYAITFYNEEVKRDYRKREMLEEFLNKIKGYDLEVGELIAKYLVTSSPLHDSIVLLCASSHLRKFDILLIFVSTSKRLLLHESRH